jgi:EAL domain-containing protein (putative c-di-GMP-specific phosphodiesterase class I)
VTPRHAKDSSQPHGFAHFAQNLSGRPGDRGRTADWLGAGLASFSQRSEALRPSSRPNRLDLEIDEGALIRETEAAQALLAPLRAAGVSVVADHFGTGFSDLQNLHRLKLDGIKIDRSFIAAMLHDRQAAVMVKALIGIGQGLDLAIIADGVVTEQQKAALAAQGCDQGQGALYGGVVSAEEATALVSGAPQLLAAG